MEFKTDVLVAVDGHAEWRILEDNTELYLQHGVIANPNLYEKSTIYKKSVDTRLYNKIAELRRQYEQQHKHGK